MRASQASSRIPRFFYHLGVFLILAGAFLLLAYFSAPAQAQNFGLEAAREGTGIPKLKLAELIGRIISVALGLVGTIFLLLMLYAGFMWMTARGAPDQVKKAKEVLTGAIIGIVIVAGAYTITNLIISNLGVRGTGVSEELTQGGEGAGGGGGQTGGGGEEESAGGGGAPTAPVCGNGTCEGGESSSSCPADCGAPPPGGGTPAPGSPYNSFTCSTRSCTKHADCILPSDNGLAQCYSGTCLPGSGEDCSDPGGCPTGHCQPASGQPEGSTVQIPKYTTCSIERSCSGDNADAWCGPGSCGAADADGSRFCDCGPSYTAEECDQFLQQSMTGGCLVGSSTLGPAMCQNRCNYFQSRYGATIVGGCSNVCFGTCSYKNPAATGIAPGNCSP